MSVERHRCYLLTCDDCAIVHDEMFVGCLLHFDTVDEALTSATDSGWTITDTGQIRCPRCTTMHACATTGHELSVWVPCACRGSIPAHALFGCDLYRACGRSGCDFVEVATLAALPETTEPTRG